MKTILAAAALTLFLAACGDSASVNNSDTASAANLTSPPDSEDAATDTRVMMNGTAVATPVTGVDFANSAAAADQFEIRSSELARTKAGSAEIKSFATMLIAEHGKSTEELKAAGAQTTPAIVPTAELTAEQQANLDALGKAANGQAFDTLYAQMQVPAHENALALMRGYAVRGDQPMLKSFAAKTATVVQKHLEQARGLAN